MNCWTRGSLIESTLSRRSHATSTIGEAIPSTGVASRRGLAVSPRMVATSAALVEGAYAIHTAPCSSECTAFSTGWGVE
jgi:hypothetical protein